MLIKKTILLLFLITSSISFLKLFNTTTFNTSFGPDFFSVPVPTATCSCAPPVSEEHGSSSYYPVVDNFTSKELNLLSSIIARRAPCNLLVFGLKPQLLSIATLNSGGTTVFLEDSPEKLQWPRPRIKSVHAYQVQYNAKARDAYNMLRHAREDLTCEVRHERQLQASKCPLALKNLPEIVYERNWNVIVVDGPGGDRPEAPGRMSAIYSVSIMARCNEHTSDVLIHNVDRSIEKWYSWEFLCQQNLVRSKGKLWHFRVKGNFNSSAFCED